MICQPKPLSRAEKLAREIAEDPRESALLGRIPRAKSDKPLAFKPQLKATASKVIDVENTAMGLRARIELLEHRCNKLEAQNIELATELRQTADYIREGRS